MENIEYKLLALDIDGTTLNDDGIISEENIEYISKIIESGIKVTLISGRCQYTLSKIAKQLNLNGYMSALNGNIIFNLDDEKVVAEHVIDENILMNLLNISQDTDSMLAVFIGDYTYVESVDDPIAVDFQKFTEIPFVETGNMIDYLIENDLTHKVNKIAFVDDYEKLKKLRDKIPEELSESLSQVFSLPICLEIFNNKIGKGSALREIANLYDIDRSQIIAIGDGENDIDMLKYAGKGIATENCMSLVKYHADEITVSNNDHAVARVIQKYFLA
ncbi:MAG: Cof-type HAD-IIB family hydrolase [Tissierellia bacterium]|nr:Cof-type HAD-IIB family hydrolase [Tissierellia bacterium]